MITLFLAGIVAVAAHADPITGLLQYDYGYGTYLAYELAVFIVEAIGFKLVIRCRWNEAVLASFLANLASVAFGLLSGWNVVTANLLGMAIEVVMAYLVLRRRNHALVLGTAFVLNLATMGYGPEFFMRMVPTPSALNAYCAQHLKVIGKGLAEYAQANNGILPVARDLSELQAKLGPYVGAKQGTFTCPQDRFDRDEPDYVWNDTLSGRPLPPSSSQQSKIIAIVDSAPRHSNMSNVLFLDGHVKWYSTRSLIMALQHSGENYRALP
ncbi:MAG: hypothetical protein HY318_05525 [Armatimonadetes bacterium]|nr:hypothetical protein [Armatimonadota bacterium]